MGTHTLTVDRPLMDRAATCVDDPDLQLVVKELRLAGAEVLLKSDLHPSVIPLLNSPRVIVVRFVRVRLDGRVYELGTCKNGFWMWDNNVEGWEICTFDLHDALDVMLKKIRRCET